MVKIWMLVVTVMTANLVSLSEAQFDFDMGGAFSNTKDMATGLFQQAFDKSKAGLSSIAGAASSAGSKAAELGAGLNPIAGRSLPTIWGSSPDRSKAIDPVRVRAADSSEEARPHHHHHHHSQSKKKYRSDQQAVAVSNQQKREESQLQSSGGGFNANLNQNNNFSPSFGNIGDVGSVGVFDPVSGRQYHPVGSTVDGKEASRLLFPAHKRHAKSFANYPKKFSKPEYFFDFRQIFFPKDNSDSSSDESSSSEEDGDLGFRAMF